MCAALPLPYHAVWRAAVQKSLAISHFLMNGIFQTLKVHVFGKYELWTWPICCPGAQHAALPASHHPPLQGGGTWSFMQHSKLLFLTWSSWNIPGLKILSEHTCRVWDQWSWFFSPHQWLCSKCDIHPEERNVTFIQKTRWLNHRNFSKAQILICKSTSFFFFANAWQMSVLWLLRHGNLGWEEVCIKIKQPSCHLHKTLNFNAFCTFSLLFSSTGVLYLSLTPIYNILFNPSQVNI